MDQEIIGEYIQNLRKKNNMTQSEFAKKLNVTAQAVSKWENGRGIPDIEFIRKISLEFNVDINEMLNGKNIITVKSKKNFLFLSGGVILFVLMLVCFLCYKIDYKMLDIISSNKVFSVKGIAVYSSDKNSIYISSIDYLGCVEKEKFVNIECTLYESNDNMEQKLSKFTSSKNDGNQELCLCDLLKDIDFKVDGYSSVCGSLDNSNLFININAEDKNGKVTNYNIPLRLTSSCEN